MPEEDQRELQALADFLVDLVLKARANEGEGSKKESA